MALHLLDPRGAGQRFAYALVCAVIAWFATPGRWSGMTRGLVAGDVAALVLLGFASWFILRSSSEETRKRAATEDPGRFIVWLIVLAVSAISLFAATFVLRDAKSLPQNEGRLVCVLAVATGGLAWLLTHAEFTLRYAHLYYRAGVDEEGGIDFPGGDKPDDLDFAYFAFTIGMTFQVSDTEITSRFIRRTATGHALMSFAYNSGILALVINVVLAQAS